MLRTLLAFSLLAAPAAAFAQPADGRWDLARAGGSCMLHAASPHGTVLSIWGFAGQDKFGFLIQNPEWESLRDGQRYDLELGFTGSRAWPVETTAKHGLDSDGPGYFFTFQPGEQADGGSFLEALAAARGLKISRDGAAVDSLPLAGGRDAVAALARCVAQLWEAPAEVELDKQDLPTPLDPIA